MATNNQIDALIAAGWRVFESGFSEVAFRNWRKESLECLTLLLGSDHPYTDYFKSKILEAERGTILTGVGVLTATRLGRSAGGTLEQTSDPASPVPINGSVPHRPRVATE